MLTDPLSAIILYSSVNHHYAWSCCYCNKNFKKPCTISSSWLHQAGGAYCKKISFLCNCNLGLTVSFSRNENKTFEAFVWITNLHQGLESVYLSISIPISLYIYIYPSISMYVYDISSVMCGLMWSSFLKSSKQRWMFCSVVDIMLLRVFCWEELVLSASMSCREEKQLQIVLRNESKASSDFR